MLCRCVSAVSLDRIGIDDGCLLRGSVTDMVSSWKEVAFVKNLQLCNGMASLATGGRCIDAQGSKISDTRYGWARSVHVRIRYALIRYILRLTDCSSLPQAHTTESLRRTEYGLISGSPTSSRTTRAPHHKTQSDFCWCRICVAHCALSHDNDPII